MQIENTEKKTSAVMKSTMDVAVNYADQDSCPAEEIRTSEPKDSDRDIIVDLCKPRAHEAITIFLFQAHHSQRTGYRRAKTSSSSARACPRHPMVYCLSISKFQGQHYRGGPYSDQGYQQGVRVDSQGACLSPKISSPSSDILTEVGYLFIPLGPRLCAERSRESSGPARPLHLSVERVSYIEADFKAFVQKGGFKLCGHSVEHYCRWL